MGLVFLPFGLLIGALVRSLTAGRTRGGWTASIGVGGLGAMLGGFFGRAFMLVHGEQPRGFVASLLGAFVLVLCYRAFLVRRVRA